jgi:hypothetical protein
MDKDFRYFPADNAVYSRWAHRKSWTLVEASWVLSGYERDDYRWRDDLLEADIERMTHVSRSELALLEGVKQKKCRKRMRPSEWITFAHERGIDIPSALEKFFPDRRSVFQLREDLERELLNSRAEIAALQKAQQDAAETQKPSVSRWPWGDYETELLRKLADAAEAGWQRYDATDPTTAPTNKQVSDRLIAQGVASRTAEVMATILRADGLHTGPRK